MAHVFANGVLETSTTTGTGALTLNAAVAGYKRFGAVCAVGDTVHYRIEEVSATGTPTGNYELGRGTYSAANTLTRTTVVESSNANAAINITAATRVSLTILAPNTSAQVLADWQDVLMTSQTQGFGTTGGAGAYGVTRLVNPGGATYGNSATTETGAIKIKLPVSWNNTMMKFKVEIYEYTIANSIEGTAPARTIHIGGYNWDGSGTPANAKWINTFAYQEGEGADINVRFGYDGTNCCVWIGDTGTVWNYPHVAVTEVELGFTGQTALRTWNVNWAISLVTTITTAAITYSAPMCNRQAAGVMGSGDSTASFEIRNNGGTGDSNMAMIRFWALGNYGIKMGLRADGYFGLGGWSRGTWSWYSAPDGSMVAAGNITGFSDERLKTNWRAMPKNYVVRLSQVTAGIYDRTDTKLTQVGVGAQSLRKLLPWAVTKGIDGILGVSYGHAALASTVELAKDNVDLRNTLRAEIKARKALERRLARLEQALVSNAKVKKK